MQIKFAKATEFHRELKEKVAVYFESTGLSQRDVPRMYVKSGIITAWFVASYLLLVFVAGNLLLAIALAVSLALAAAAIGMNIQHDGSHGGYSNSRLVNRLAVRQC